MRYDPLVRLRVRSRLGFLMRPMLAVALAVGSMAAACLASSPGPVEAQHPLPTPRADGAYVRVPAAPGSGFRQRTGGMPFPRHQVCCLLGKRQLQITYAHN